MSKKSQLKIISYYVILYFMSVINLFQLELSICLYVIGKQIHIQLNKRCFRVWYGITQIDSLNRQLHVNK